VELVRKSGADIYLIYSFKKIIIANYLWQVFPYPKLNDGKLYGCLLLIYLTIIKDKNFV
jgi:hypothetical protein